MNKKLYYTNFMKLIVIDFLRLTTKLVKGFTVKLSTIDWLSVCLVMRWTKLILSELIL